MNMTTLNTIIEEEVEFLFSGENEVGKFKHQGIGNCTKENITTAMQRAYKEGRVDWLRSEIEKLESLRRPEEKTLLSMKSQQGRDNYFFNLALTSIITRYKEELKELESK